MKNPAKIEIYIIEKLNNKISLTNHEIIEKAINIIINEPLASPLNPSIILIELETPAIAKQENAIETMVIDKK